MSGPHRDLAMVIDFIHARIPPPRPAAMTAATDLRSDLRMIWEDAETFMEAFFTTFNVSPGDFRIARYFPREGGLWTAFAASIAGRRRADPPRLTIGMLARAVRDGVWRNEVGDDRSD